MLRESESKLPLTPGAVERRLYRLVGIEEDNLGSDTSALERGEQEKRTIRQELLAGSVFTSEEALDVAIEETKKKIEREKKQRQSAGELPLE